MRLVDITEQKIIDVSYDETYEFVEGEIWR